MRYPKWLGILCALGLLCLQSGLAQAAPENGWWWNPNQSGRGFSIEIEDSFLFMAGYLYEDDGHATWLISHGAMQDATTFQGRLEAYSNGQTLTGDYQAPAAPTDAGAVTLQFTDDSHGTLTLPGGSIPIERFRYGSAAAASFQPENGWWWNEAESGRGFFIEIQGDKMFVAGYMYDANGKPVWYVSGDTMAAPNTYQGNWLQFANGQTLTGPYMAPSDPPTNVGTVRLEFPAPDQATLTLSDDQPPTAASPPASKSGPQAVPKIITLKPLLPKPPKPKPIVPPGIWKGTFTYIENNHFADLGSSSHFSWKGDITWVEDELSPLNGTNYIMLEGKVTVTFDEKLDFTSSGTHTVCTGNGEKKDIILPAGLSRLHLGYDGSYTGSVVYGEIEIPFTEGCTLTTPGIGTSLGSEELTAKPYLAFDFTGNVVYFEMKGNVNVYTGPISTIDATWDFTGQP
jgi:hypothetical protein